MLRRITIDWNELADFRVLENPFPNPERIFPGLDDIDPETFPDFLDDIGHVGMGGSGFRTSEKIRASIGAHTLVINGVECEPGITADQSVLLNDSLWVAAGANASAKAIGATKVILATKEDGISLDDLNKRYGEFRIERFPAKYPAGAEKLIKVWTIPAGGTFPF